MRALTLAILTATVLVTRASAQERPRGWVMPGGQSADAQMVAFVDIITLRRSGDISTADGLMVPRSGGLFPNYIRMRVEVDCARRTGTMRGSVVHQPNGTVLRELGQDSPPFDLAQRDQPTLDIFCGPNGGNGLRAFTTTAAAIAEVRR